MSMAKRLPWIVSFLAALAATCAGAYPGENIKLDPVSGNYIITYWDASTEDSHGNPTQPELVQTTFVPATKIAPTIHSRFRMRGENVNYNYAVSNGITAKQAVIGIILEQAGRIANEQDVPAKTATESELESAMFANITALNSPEDWSGNIIRTHSRIVWRADDLRNGGVKAGRVQSGFGFYSSVLPGIREASMKGKGEIFGYGGAGPAEDSSIREELAGLLKCNFVLRYVAAPAITAPEPFDAAILLDRIRAHVATWPGKQLLDPAFAAQLDRSMLAAAEAYRRNQPKAGKEHIESLRKLLDREHKFLDHDDEDNEDTPEHKQATHNTIDRLAARVLDFDLRYVLKRTEHDQEPEHKDGDHKKER